MERGSSPRAVEEYRQSLLSMPVSTGSTIAAVPTGAQELLTPGEADEAAMDEGGEIEGFTSYWDERTGRTELYPAGGDPGEGALAGHGLAAHGRLEQLSDPLCHDDDRPALV